MSDGGRIQAKAITGVYEETGNGSRGERLIRHVRRENVDGGLLEKKADNGCIRQEAIAPVYRDKAVPPVYTEELTTPGSRR